MARRKNAATDETQKLIRQICDLYGDSYDDRIEDSRPPVAGSVDGCPDKREAGADWKPGMPAAHKSLSAFQKELADRHGIRLSTSKIRKLLISGGVWTTERSREVQALYEELCREHRDILPEQAVREAAKQLGVSVATVSMNLPYINGANKLENRSKNAVRCARYRKKKREK